MQDTGGDQQQFQQHGTSSGLYSKCLCYPNAKSPLVCQTQMSLVTRKVIFRDPILLPGTKQVKAHIPARSPVWPRSPKRPQLPSESHPYTHQSGEVPWRKPESLWSSPESESCSSARCLTLISGTLQNLLKKLGGTGLQLLTGRKKNES